MKPPTIRASQVNRAARATMPQTMSEAAEAGRISGAVDRVRMKLPAESMIIAR